MCTPTVIAAAGTALATGGTAAATAGTAGTISTLASLAGGAISAYSTYQNGMAQASAYKATAQEQEAAAQEEVEAGERKVQLQRRKIGQVMGQQTAQLAANGVDVNSQAAQDILIDTRTEGEEDALAIRTDATRAANADAQEASNSYAAASSAKSQAIWGTVGTILGTSGTVADKWSKYTSKAASGSY